VLQKTVQLTSPGAFSLSYSVTAEEVACAHCLISVLLGCHVTVASENLFLPMSPNKKSSITYPWLICPSQTEVTGLCRGV